jgi:hypothetical protein
MRTCQPRRRRSPPGANPDASSARAARISRWATLAGPEHDLTQEGGHRTVLGIRQPSLVDRRSQGSQKAGSCAHRSLRPQFAAPCPGRVCTSTGLNNRSSARFPMQTPHLKLKELHTHTARCTGKLVAHLRITGAYRTEGDPSQSDECASALIGAVVRESATSPGNRPVLRHRSNATSCLSLAWLR